MSKKLTEKELRDFYERVVESPYFMVYSTIQKQLIDVCNQFDNTVIDITGEMDDTFKNYLAFVKTSKDLLDSMEGMLTKLDPTRAIELKEKQTKAGVNALENFVKQGK